MVHLAPPDESPAAHAGTAAAVDATARRTWERHDDRHELRASLVQARSVVRRGPPPAR
jgi:hypothetical protein